MRGVERHGLDKFGAGPYFFDALVARYPEITIFDPSAFYPDTLAEREHAVAIHHAARSWKDEEGFRHAATLARRRLGQTERRLVRVEQERARTQAMVDRLERGQRRYSAAGFAKRVLVVGIVFALEVRSAVRSRLRPVRRRLRRLGAAVGAVLAAGPTLARSRRALRRVDDLRIPRLIHHVWLEDGEPGPAERARRRSWRLRHPGWECRLWTEATLPDDLRPEVYERLRSPAERTDVLRLELLRLHGGVCVDFGIECLRPAGELLAGRDTAVSTTAPGAPSTAVVAAVPGHPLVGRALAELRPREIYGYDGDATGAGALARALGADEDALLEPAAFLPRDAAERERAVGVDR